MTATKAIILQKYFSNPGHDRPAVFDFGAGHALLVCEIAEMMKRAEVVDWWVTSKSGDLDIAFLGGGEGAHELRQKVDAIAAMSENVCSVCGAPGSEHEILVVAEIWVDVRRERHVDATAAEIAAWDRAIAKGIGC